MTAEKSLATKAYRACRPALFLLDPEFAHEKMAKPLLRHGITRLLEKYFDVDRDALSFDLTSGDARVHLSGPIGLAAGFDKNSEMLRSLRYVFDYVTVGTVLPYYWPGNPKRRTGTDKHVRRIVRIEEEEATLNCLGFPFDGTAKTIRNIMHYKGDAPISINVSVRPVEGEDQSKAVEEFRGLMEKLAFWFPEKLQMIEANFASPNTKGLSAFLEGSAFMGVAKALLDAPFGNALKFLKMPPHTDDETKTRNLRAVQRWLEMGGNGITAIDTLEVEDSRLSMGIGGKGGQPIYQIMLSNIRDYRQHFGSAPIINAVGGITADRVPDLLIKEGADTVQLFTSFIYEGPGIVRDAKVALLDALDKAGYASLQEMYALRR